MIPCCLQHPKHAVNVVASGECVVGSIEWSAGIVGTNAESVVASTATYVVLIDVDDR